ncbi:hypothetical protein HWD35_10470 [Tsukamurella tyrosinosolvens]|nr:hypothetical protein [Tsukamurella tyrosinosolvens]MCA4995136.1 hypothetical protein [Tsukamurella tyrosinosolvens]
MPQEVILKWIDRDYHQVAVFVIVPSLFVHRPMHSQYALASTHELKRDFM